MTDIRATLGESRVFAPDPEFARQAQISAQSLAALHAEAEADPAAFWAHQARQHLHWDRPFSQILDASRPPFYTWFADGTTNASYNCLDRHLPALADKPAILFEGEPGDRSVITYGELHARVCRAAAALKAQGVEQGDRVVIFLPHIPEVVVAMLACARMGATHSVVFGGFSAQALADRIADCGARLLITADGNFYNGKVVALKSVADEALRKPGCSSIEAVWVVRRTGAEVPMQAGRDLRWDAVMTSASATCPPSWVGAEHPLFLLYTSGSTGKPKGIVHSTAGYLLGAQRTFQWVFDWRPSDVYWCTANVGWVTGHSYVVYGPLAAGATQVMYEGSPTAPHPGRFWEICARYGVSIFYTAPTAIRALMRYGDAVVQQHDLSALRLLGSVGEPINPEAWMWYRDKIGGGRCPIVDTWWQTETGAIMIAPVPGVTATKPGSCTKPLPGIDAAIVDEAGVPVTQPGHGGLLVIRKPWPSMLRTIWGSDARYESTYWQRLGPHTYVAGDGAHRDEDGYVWILGRIDDVLNVSGHRLGTTEIESVLVAHAAVAEAAVVGGTDPIKGESVIAFVVPRGHGRIADVDPALAATLRQWVAQEIGAIARPDTVYFCDGLPKTRSGKIMRRLLRSLARKEPLTEDTSTLENPQSFEELAARVRAAQGVNTL